MISLADLQQRIEQGALSPEAAILRSQDAIRVHDKTIGAFVCTDDRPEAKDFVKDGALEIRFDGERRHARHAV